jgi:hypothetical protein
MFAGVTDPFPEDQRVRHPALSVGTINKIKTMRQQGFNVAAIAKELKVSQQTVRRYAKEGSKEQRSRSGAEGVGQGEERRG